MYASDLASEHARHGQFRGRLADVAESSLGHDDVLRSHLRNIEAYIARLSEDVVQGREQSVQDLRGDIRIVARTIAALAEEPRR